MAAEHLESELGEAIITIFVSSVCRWTTPSFFFLFFFFTVFPPCDALRTLAVAHRLNLDPKQAGRQTDVLWNEISPGRDRCEWRA